MAFSEVDWEEKMTEEEILATEAEKELTGCINHWEAKLRHDRHLMEPSTQGLVESTVKFLKELKQIQEKSITTKLSE